jgi:hypothetical protein
LPANFSISAATAAISTSRQFPRRRCAAADRSKASPIVASNAEAKHWSVFGKCL